MSTLKLAHVRANHHSLRHAALCHVRNERDDWTSAISTGVRTRTSLRFGTSAGDKTAWDAGCLGT